MPILISASVTETKLEVEASLSFFGCLEVLNSAEVTSELTNQNA